jgi:hypothetical protein
MVDALSLGASAVAFISLVGQVLQGCQYICDFVDNVRDAPGDLRHFGAEIKGFRAAVLAFQDILQQFEHLMILEAVSAQIGFVLNSANLAINDLKSLVEKYESDRKRDWWKNIKIAKKKARFARCVERLGRAKADFALAQSNTSL